MQRARHVRVACAQDKFKYCILNLGCGDRLPVSRHIMIRSDRIRVLQYHFLKLILDPLEARVLYVAQRKKWRLHYHVYYSVITRVI